ncbi:hypothetical protein BC332_18159 [Capsicum chinense]|nr:hypothetical protein BC332_18159 [Capsicum chinense]
MLLRSLSVLDLGSNSLNGSIPASLGNLTSLSYLQLHENQLSRSIPPEIGYLRSLSVLDLGSNSLNSSIPASIGNLNSLSYLFLYGNQLSDLIPSEIGYLRSLTNLDLSINSLNGSIPLEIGYLRSLIVLNLGMNSLNGSIPASLGNLTSSSDLHLYENQLSVSIPPEIGYLSLSLHENELEGKIPRSLANCIELQVLDLGDNHLSDTFPVWLENLPYLRVLRLKSNKLHGPIRSSAAEIMFPDLRIIDLSYNAFSKELPECLFQHLKGMRTIDQTMMVPSDDGSGYYEDLVVVVTKGLKLKVKRILSLYTVIDLSSNSFEGHIPSIMGDLIAIRISGDIPQQLASLTFLEFLNLSHNHLRGCIPQGPQLHTFEINSYQGNDGLCGFPVSKGCGNDSVLETNNTKSALDDQESNSESFDDFCKGALTGYGYGLCIGLSILYFTLSTGNPKWIARITEELEQKIIMRRRKKQPRQRNYRRRNNRI